MKNATSKDIERACQMVYEHYIGKCWHEGTGMWLPSNAHCIKCKMGIATQVLPYPLNPPLSTSLDAWREIWDAMRKDKSRYRRFGDELCGIYWRGYPRVEERDIKGYIWEAEPLHHLEAALRAAGLYDTWKEVRNEQILPTSRQ